MHKQRSEVLFLHLQSIDNSRPRGFPVNLRAYQPYIIFPVHIAHTHLHSITEMELALCHGIYDSLFRSTLFNSPVSFFFSSGRSLFPFLFFVSQTLERAGCMGKISWDRSRIIRDRIKASGAVFNILRFNCHGGFPF